MLQYARKAGYEYYVASPNKGFINIVDGGLLILSRYPIIKTNKMVFKKPGFGKGVIYARIAITPSVIVHLFNCHLERGEVSHLAQLKEFMDDSVRGKPANEPIFVVGDFGMNAKVPC
jgi:endonuclease/exonuclease/phosphatase family metal-dependent hydrolase